MDGEATEMLILTIFSIACLCVDIYRSAKIKKREDDDLPEQFKTPSHEEGPY